MVKARSEERRLVSEDLLGTKGYFEFRGNDVPVDKIAYVQWSVDTNTWVTQWTDQMLYIRYSTDYAVTWSDPYPIGGLSDGSIFVSEDPNFPVVYITYNAEGGQVVVTEVAKPYGRISGGFVTWTSGFNFNVTPAAYYIEGDLYDTLDAPTSVTLDASDPTYPRIDVIAVDVNEDLIVLKGTATSNVPVKPVIDPATQVELTYVLIPAGSTEPGNDGVVYLSGDITGSGALGTDIATTLATVNTNVGTFGSATEVAKVTVNAKGLVTAVEEVAIGFPAETDPLSLHLDQDPAQLTSAVSIEGTEEIVMVKDGALVTETWDHLKEDVLGDVVTEETDPLSLHLDQTNAQLISNDPADSDELVAVRGTGLISITKSELFSFNTINGDSILGTGDLAVQEVLESGVNIKTINGETILGAGDITIAGGIAPSKNTFTATEGQTTFTIPGGYMVGTVDVFLNGSYLNVGEYTATNGTTIVLASGVPAGTEIEVKSGEYVEGGLVSSVDVSVPTGFSATGGPITSAGVIAIEFAEGYSLPTDLEQAAWDAKQEAIPFVTETDGEFLRDDGTFQSIEPPAGGYANNLYYDEADSDITGYDTLTYTPSGTQTEHSHTVNVSEGNKLLHNYIYPSGVAVSLFPSGLWSFNFYGRVSTASGVTKLGITYFKRSTIGDETELFTSWSNEINNLTDEWIKWDITNPSFDVSPTDRMGARVLAQTTHNVDVTIYYAIGDGYGSYLNNPNKIRHSQLRDLNGDSDYLHVTSTEKSDWNSKQPGGTYSTDIHNNISALNNVSGTNTGNETTTTIGALIGSADDATPNDTDYVATSLTSGGILKKITWANVKTFLKTFFDNYWGNVLNKTQQSYHGFVNTADSSLPSDIATNAGTLVFTLAKVNDFTVYVDGVPIVKTASVSIDLMLQAAWGNGTTDPIGQWYVWFKADGTLGASKTAWSILDVTITPVAVVWVQSTGGSNFEGIVSEERHNYKRNLLEHKNQHDSWGAQYVSGFTTETIGTGVVGNSTNTFSLAGGTIRDEELYAVISNPQTSCRIGYKDGANNWMKFDSSSAAYVKLSGAEPVYDNNGTLTPIPTTSGGRYGVVWAYATNRKVVPIVHILGQGFYNSVSLAQAAPLPTLYGFSVAEWKLCYRIIIRNVAGSLQWIQSDPLYNVSSGPAVVASAIANPTASNVSYVAGGNIVATNVQTAIEELDSEKIPNSGGILNIQKLTQAEYTALTPKSSTTLYVIVG